MNLLPNPSHLEAVNPVAMGKARGRLLSLGGGQGYCHGGEEEEESGEDRNKVRMMGECVSPLAVLSFIKLLSHTHAHTHIHTCTHTHTHTCTHTPAP